MGLAYLFITHNISVVEFLAHEVAVMYLGRIVERGTVDEVLARRSIRTRGRCCRRCRWSIRRRSAEVIRLQGDLPSPVNPPAGCHFHPRCPAAFAPLPRILSPRPRASPARTQQTATSIRLIRQR